MPPGREHSLDLDDDFASSLPVPPRQQPALPTVPPTTKCKQDPQLVRRVVDLAKNGATLSDIDAALHAEGFCNSIGTLKRKQMAPSSCAPPSHRQASLASPGGRAARASAMLVGQEDQLRPGAHFHELSSTVIDSTVDGRLCLVL